MTLHSPLPVCQIIHFLLVHLFESIDCFISSDNQSIVWLTNHAIHSEKTGRHQLQVIIRLNVRDVLAGDRLIRDER